MVSTMYAIAESETYTLTCHPQTPSRTAHEINVMVSEAANGSLILAFSLTGDISSLNVPEPRSPRQASELWQHICFEVFVMEGEGPEYYEFNFSPSGEWAVFAFSGYRDSGELDIHIDPEIVVRKMEDRLELDAVISREYLPQGDLFRLGLSAVVEDTHGDLSYWAFRHPPGKPDFHHIDAFALKLGVPECIT